MVKTLNLLLVFLVFALFSTSALAEEIFLPPKIQEKYLSWSGFDSFRFYPPSQDSGKEFIEKLNLELQGYEKTLKDLQERRIKAGDRPSELQALLGKIDQLFSDLKNFQERIASYQKILPSFYQKALLELQAKSEKLLKEVEETRLKITEKIIDYQKIFNILSGEKEKLKQALAASEEKLKTALVNKESGKLPDLKKEFESLKILVEESAEKSEYFARQLYRFGEDGLGDRFGDLAAEFESISKKASHFIEVIDFYLDEKKGGNGEKGNQDNSPPGANQTKKDGGENDGGEDKTQKENLAEKKVKALEQEYTDYEDEYDELKEDYQEAQEDKDQKKVKGLKEDLEDLKDDLDDLDDRIDDSQKEIKEKSFLDRLEDLEKDVKKLKKKISDLLKGETETRTEETPFLEQTSLAPSPEPEPEVVVNEMSFPITTNPPASENSQETEIKTLAWLAGGIIILFVVILFLLAALLG